MALGNLIIVAAPSGAGKTSLVAALLQADPAIHLSVSYATRAPRPNEVDGRDYHFVSVQDFEAMRERGELLESAEVHGNFYGTSRTWVTERLAGGEDVLLEIDWQGAAQVRRSFAAAIGIFVLPPSMAVLAQRLRGRASDSAQTIARRLAAAREEIAHVAEFDYVIINERFDEAVQDLSCIVRAERLRTTTQLHRHPNLLDQFDSSSLHGTHYR